MANIQQTQNTTRSFSFYLYNLEMGQILKVSSTSPARITVPKQRITPRNLSLFERAVIYIPPAQQARLPAYIKHNYGFIAYLKACSLMIPSNFLPTNTSHNDRSKHQFNSTAAFELLELSATHGFAPAQTVLSYCYNYGTGVKANPDTAIKWLQKAAQQKYPKAEYELTNHYLHQIHSFSESEPMATPPAPTPAPSPSPYSQPKQLETTPEWSNLSSRMQLMEQKHQAEIQSLDQKHQGAIEALQQAHEASNKIYQDEIETLKQTNQTLNERLHFLEIALHEASKDHKAAEAPSVLWPLTTHAEKPESNKRGQYVKGSRPKRQKRTPKHLE